MNTVRARVEKGYPKGPMTIEKKEVVDRAMPKIIGAFEKKMTLIIVTSDSLEKYSGELAEYIQNNRNRRA